MMLQFLWLRLFCVVLIFGNLFSGVALIDGFSSIDRKSSTSKMSQLAAAVKQGDLSHDKQELLPPHTTTTTTSRRSIPETVLIGYATSCNDKVKTAVQQGVNVVIWAFMGLHKNDDDHDKGFLTLPPLDDIEQMISDLNDMGYNDTVHLVSFGGWNGPHIDPNFGTEEDCEAAAKAWFDLWKEKVGHVFHGIDWDLEGETDMQAPTNYFTKYCLETMGLISKLAKEDGYIVSMAPAQSYLDISTNKFSRFVNITEPNRPWHAEFSYFGPNVYAYVLAKYGNFIDLISIQFYESYSRAAMSIHYYGLTPSKYIELYIYEILELRQEYFVDFDNDLGLSSQKVSIPLSKIVLGLANGWAISSNGRHVYISPKEIGDAYTTLHNRFSKNNNNNNDNNNNNNSCCDRYLPRGCMFWLIDNEGNEGVNFASGLNQVLQIRPEALQVLNNQGEKKEF